MILARNNIRTYPNLLVGLESFWKLDDNSIDSVGSNDGTDVNVGYAQGKFGKAADFNANPTSYIVLGSDIPVLNNASRFSVSCWVKFKSISNLQRIISKWAYGTQGSWAVTQASTSSFGGNYGIYFFLCNSLADPGGNVTYTNVVLSADVWYHVCCVFDGSQPTEITRAKIYINGVNQTAGYIGAINTTTTSGNDPIRLGVFNGDSTNPANNRIDEVGVWSRALTQEEVVQLYTSSYPYNSKITHLEKKPSIFNGLTAYWRLDGNSVDAVGTNNGADTAITYPTNEYATFNGSTSKITVPSNIYLSTGDIDFTISAWVNLTSKTDPVYGNGIVGKWKYTTNNKEYILWYNYTNDRFRLEISSDGSTQSAVQADSFGSPSTSTWYFIVVWHDSINNTINIQVNNGTIDSTTHSTGVYVGNGPFEFGSYDGQAFINGSINGVGFWRRLLTAEERTFLYNSGTGREYPFNIEKIQRYYKLDGNSIDSVAGNNGTDTDMVYSSGKINLGASFDGISSKIDIPAFTVAYPNEYTFSFWIIPRDDGTGPYSGLGGILSSTSYGLVNYSNIGTPYILFSSNVSSASSGFLTAGEWTHVACTINSSGTIQFYVNGVSAGATGTYTTSVNFDSIGYFGAYTAYLDTKLDEVAIWNRRLTQEEISSLYNQGRGFQYPFYQSTKTILSHENKITPHGLLLWQDATKLISYPGSGNVWKDISGNGNNGTLINSPTHSSGVDGNFNFNGTNQYVNCGNILDSYLSGPNVKMTWSVWVNVEDLALDSENNYASYLISKSNGALGISLLVGGFYSTLPFVSVVAGEFVGLANYDITTTTQLPLNTWVNIVLVYDGTLPSDYGKIYFNGVLQPHTITTDTSGTIGSNTEVLKIAAGNISPDRYFLGKISNVQIFNRALSVEEITANYNIYKDTLI
jgi:hypothetical protein